jgi:hypothetical protein
MDDFPPELEIPAPIALPELDEGVDLEAALVDARWQTAVTGSLVRSITQEIEQVKAAPDEDERELDRLTEDLHEWSRLYLMATLDAAMLLELSRHRQEKPVTQAFTLAVVPSSQAALTMSEPESRLTR